MCCLTALGCAWIVSIPKAATPSNPVAAHTRTNGSVYEIHSEAGRIFVFDKESGAAWRYFLQYDHGKLVDEGFTQVRYVNMHLPIGADFEELPTPTQVR